MLIENEHLFILIPANIYHLNHRGSIGASLISAGLYQYIPKFPEMLIRFLSDKVTLSTGVLQNRFL